MQADIPQGNAGSAPNLDAKEAVTAQGNARIIYMKFDLSTATVAGDGNQATFTINSLEAAETTYDFSLFALNAGTSGFGWSESTITWNTRPGASASQPYISSPGSATFLGDFDLVNNAPIGSFSVSFANWDSFRQTDNTMTLILVATSQGSTSPSMSFASSEHQTVAGPTLNIVPEPGRAVLLLLGAFGLVSVRRRAVGR